jgi:hypothetical protein
MRLIATILAATLTIGVTTTAQAFCGFYVAKADTSLFNRASQVVLVRDGKRTVLTMANDFEGDVKDFAVVVPVPTFIERGQINVGDKAVMDHLDAYTSPRLVEYFDPDPCLASRRREMSQDMAGLPSSKSALESEARSQGVTIEASYTVGEYDILILSAAESNGLIAWLNNNGYRVPRGAESVVSSYLKQDMRFFVAKVNVEEQKKSGYTYLRPLQVAYESNKFMLPIRLGTLNAKQQQDLYVYALTRTGRVETILPGHVLAPDGCGEQSRRIPRIRLGHVLVRPLCCRPAVGPGASQPRRILAGGSLEFAEAYPGRCPECIRHPAARPVRSRALSRGSDVPGDR